MRKNNVASISSISVIRGSGFMEGEKEIHWERGRQWGGGCSLVTQGNIGEGKATQKCGRKFTGGGGGITMGNQMALRQEIRC